jgi:hypothetical protein
LLVTGFVTGFVVTVVGFLGGVEVFWVEQDAMKRPVNIGRVYFRVDIFMG